MKDSGLIADYIRVVAELAEQGFKVSATTNAFFIHNSKGTIVGDVFTVEGLRGFSQGVEYAGRTDHE
jgi:hypothetical protein